MIACVLTGCTRPNPGFGDDKGGTDSGTSDTTPGETTVGADASAGSMSGASTTKPTSTTSEDTIDEDTTSATRASETLDGTASVDDTADVTDPEPSTDDGAAQCGNGIVEPGEPCEPGVRPEQSCADLMYGPGYVECSDECGLVPHCCGDGEVEDNEMCEPGQVSNCPPYVRGSMMQIECDENCQLPLQECPACGDEIVQSEVEDCDTANEMSCGQLGFDGEGAVTCEDCLWVADGCCIPDNAPCSLGDGIACCLGACFGGFCGAA